MPTLADRPSDGRGTPGSIAALSALLEEAETLSERLGLAVPGAHITNARNALRRSAGL